MEATARRGSPGAWQGHHMAFGKQTASVTRVAATPRYLSLKVVANDRNPRNHAHRRSGRSAKQGRAGHEEGRQKRTYQP